MAEKLSPTYFWVSATNRIERYFESVEAYKAFYQAHPKDPKILDRIWTGAPGKTPALYRENGSADHEL